jgi:hypothetical protein
MYQTTCGEKESCSDHNIVNFKIASVNNGKGKINYMGVRYITNQEDYKKLDTNVAANFIFTFNCITKTDPNKLDEWQGKVKQYITEDLIYDFLMCTSSL